MRAVLRRLAALLRRDRLDRDLDDEIAAHLELAERDARAAGLSAEDARRAARRAFGGLDQVREAHRDARSSRRLEVLWRDIRYGARVLRRAPVVSLTIVVVLALGIGATTAMFSAMYGILLRPLSYGDPDRLVVVMHDGRGPVSYGNFEDWRTQNRSFSAMAAAEYWRPTIGLEQGSERSLGLRVTPDLLPMLQVDPALGRLLDDTDDLRQVVLSHGLWQRLGARADAIGESIRLDGEPYMIVGVMPPAFAFAPFWAVGAELWAPLPRGRSGDRGGNSLRVFARLAPEVTVSQAQTDIDAITARLEAEFPGTNQRVRVVPLKERVVGDTRLAMTVFMAGVGFVLLIACANVAHMLLARAAARQREVAVRLAIGATRWQIVCQFAVESLLLAGLGAACGIGLAALAVQALARRAPPGLPRAGEIALDGPVLLFAMAVTLLATLLFGLAPALQTVRRPPGVGLTPARGSAGDRRQTRLHDVLMASEVAIALVLLTGAGLMVRTMAALQAIDPGFDTRHVLALSVAVQGTPHADPSRRGPFFTDVVERLRALPGVEAASAINHLPLAGDIWTRSITIDGRPRPAPGEGPAAAYRVVLPGYFAVMGMPLVRGRDFTPQDTVESPGVVIVSDNLVRRHWPGGDPLGQRILVGQWPSDPDPRWLTIVGVAPDVVRDSWDAAPGSEVYLPYLQTADYQNSTASRFTYLTIVLRSRGDDPLTLAAPARAAVMSLDRGVAISDVTAMQDVVSRALSRPRFQLTLLGVFAAVALVLTAAGVYGVLSHSVARRTREIGLRLALGAQPGQVRHMILAQAMSRVAVGVLAGLAGAAGLSHVMSSLLHGVPPGDPSTLAAATAILSAVALTAGILPAWHASRVPPVIALNDD